MRTQTLPACLAPVATVAAARKRCASLRGIALVLAAGIAVLALLALLDTQFMFPEMVRRWVAGAGIAAFVAGVARAVMRSRGHDAAEAARLMEAAHPEIGQRLRTAMEIAGQKVPAGQPEAQFFRTHLVKETQAVLSGKSWRSLIPARAMWLTAGAAGVCVAALALATVRWPDLRLAVHRVLLPSGAPTYSQIEWTAVPKSYDDRQPPRLELRVIGRPAEPGLHVRSRGGAWKAVALTRMPDGRTWDCILTGWTGDLELKSAAGDAPESVRSLTYRPVPRLLASEVILTFPAYTGLQPQKLQGGDLKAVEGTVAEWSFRFNTVPGRTDWQIGSDPPTVLPVDPGTFTGKVKWNVIPGKHAALVSVADDSGATVDSWHFQAEGVQDRLPVVEILEPKKEVEATPIAEIPVRIRARDDFGVAEMGLILEAAGETHWVMEKVITELDRKDISELAAAMLEKVPLTIRDNVRLSAYALDHKPRGGPRGRSALLAVNIRQFKRQSVYLGEMQPQPDMEMMAALDEGVQAMDDLLKEQRAIVSDLHLLQDVMEVDPASATMTARDIAVREEKTAAGAAVLAQEWADDGRIPREDVVLLGTAAQQMQESVPVVRKPDVAKGFVQTDRALTTLLQLRKKMMEMLMKMRQKMNMPSEGQQLPDDNKIIAELERLAREEADIRRQISPDAGAPSLPAVRRQQETAVADAGEIYSTLVARPDGSAALLGLMDEAEKAMQKADGTLHTEKYAESAPELTDAEQRLLDTAQFLKSMDLSALADTLKQMAKTAEENSSKQEKAAGGGKGEAEKPAPGKSEGEGEGKGEGEKSEAEKAAELAKESGEQGKEGEDNKAGQKDTAANGAQPGEKGKPGSPDPARESDKAARDAALADRILEALAQKQAGNSGVTTDPENGGEPGAQEGGSMGELREQLKAGKLGEDLAKLAELQRQGKGDSAEAKELAGKNAGALREMAGALRDEAARLEASRAAQLAAAKAQAKALKDKLAGKPEEPQKGSGDGDKPGEGKGEKPGENGAGEKPSEQGSGKGEGEKPGAEGAGKGEGEKPGEGEGKEPGEGQGQGEGEKPGEKGSGKGEGESEKPGEGEGQKPGEGQGQGEKPGDGEGAGSGQSEKEGDPTGEQPGSGGVTDNPQPEGVGKAVGRFSHTLEKLNDAQLKGYAKKLENGTFDLSTLPTVEKAEKRIDTLISQLPATPGSATGDAIPEQRRREIEDYYRDLSDDFGGEVWENQ